MKGRKKKKINKLHKKSLKTNIFMNINKLVLTKVDGAEVVMDFTKEVNVEDLASTTISKAVATKEDGTVVTVFDSANPVPPVGVPTITVPLNTPIQLVAQA